MPKRRAGTLNNNLMYSASIQLPHPIYPWQFNAEMKNLLKILAIPVIASTFASLSTGSAKQSIKNGGVWIAILNQVQDRLGLKPSSQ